MSTDTFADLEDRLRTDLPRLADSLMSSEAEPGADRSSGPAPILLDASSSSRRRWVVSAVAVAAVVLVVVGIVVAVRADDDVARPVEVGPAPTVGSWSAMAPSPLSPREAAVSVWTGSEVIVWGGRVGDMALLDGAAYDPTTDTWRSITPNSWGHPGGHGAWTGTEMVVLAKNGGAAYDSVADSWRELPLRSGSGSFVAPVWTGSQLLGIGVDVAVNDSGVSLTASTQADDGSAWHDEGSVLLPYSVFQPLPEFSVVWTGSEAVAWDPRVGRGWAYDPSAGAWRELDRLQPIEGSPVSFPVVVDQELFLVAGDTQPVTTRDAGISLLRPTPDGWQAVGTGIAGLLDSGASVTSAGEDIAVFSAGMPPTSVDPSSGTWTGIDPDRLRAGGWNPSVVWTGTDLVAWGGTDSVGRVIAAGSVWHPAG
jgi:hypothetical protein